MTKYNKNQSEKKPGQRWELSAGCHVWVYLRHSPGDNQTIDSQQSGMRQWCLENNWVIDREFIDAGVEGSKEEREQFQEMMALSRQVPRLIDGIVVWSFSRFARSQLDSQYYKAELRKRGYVVLSKVDDVPNNEIAPIIEAVIDWKNQRFLEDLAVDVKRGQTFVVEHGFWPCGRPPLGYLAEKVETGHRRNGQVRYGNRVIKDETMQDRIYHAWQMKLRDNASYTQIHEATHLFPFFKQYGMFFDNLLYAGILVYAGKRYPLDWEQGTRFCDPYVTLDEWFHVQRNRESRRITAVSPRTLSSTYLLSGLLRCGVCADKGIHSTMVGGKSSASHYRFYRCYTQDRPQSQRCSITKIACWRIDDAVLSLLRETVFTPEYVASEVERANVLSKESCGNERIIFKELERKVKVLQKEVEGYAALIAKKGMTLILEKQYDGANAAWQADNEFILGAAYSADSLFTQSMSVQGSILINRTAMIHGVDFAFSKAK